ncbi:unnamed protein product, partial [Symbiodinium sp. KB8]
RLQGASPSWGAVVMAHIAGSERGYDRLTRVLAHESVLKELGLEAWHLACFAESSEEAKAVCAEFVSTPLSADDFHDKLVALVKACSSKVLALRPALGRCAAGLKSHRCTHWLTSPTTQLVLGLEAAAGDTKVKAG